MGSRAVALSFVLSSLLSAVLLFSVQPLVGKALLPRFGGSPAVWTTCMMFFQGALLAGYVYAHLLATRTRPRTGLAIHAVVLLAGFAIGELLPQGGWTPSTERHPSLALLSLLVAHVGPPFFALAATAPLLQSWFSGVFPKRSPYPLYAVSNLGSLFAVLCYPFLVEPRWGLTRQASAWFVGYLLFVVGCAMLAPALWQLPAPAKTPNDSPRLPCDEPPPAFGTWVGLAACGSVLLLTTTDQISQDVAASPLFWIVPLALYLLSYIIGFSNLGLYSRPVWLPALGAAAAGVWVILMHGPSWPVWVQLGLYAVTLFVGCTVCHGELHRLRPGARYLTRFYLAISLGGALGGALVGLVAPTVLPDLWEYPLGWLATMTTILGVALSDERSQLVRRLAGWQWVVLCCGFVLTLAASAAEIFFNAGESSFVSRGFFGRLAVTVERDKICLFNGRIRHGCQWKDDERAMEPTTYFGPGSGVGVAVQALRRPEFDDAPRPLRIGVVGLGIGTCAAWGEEGDLLRFFEIDPAVERLARRHFTYLERSRAQIEVALGDARLLLEAETQRQEERYDLLVLDAFSGDAIPLHLLTREAFRIYWSRLHPGGVLAAHISNRHVALEPVLLDQARAAGRTALLLSNDDHDPEMIYASTWTLLVAEDRFDARIRATADIRPWPKRYATPILFTDTRSDILRILE